MARRPPDDSTPEQLYLGHLKLISQMAAVATRRHRFRPEEVEDFVSTVHLRLIQDDYAVLRKLQDRNRFKSFLSVTISHLLQDYVNHIWGKWRPSEEAQRLGPVAVRLEILLYRERLSLHEACEILLTNEKVPLSRPELEALAAKLPDRKPRPSQPTDGKEPPEPPDDTENPEERVLERERYQRKRRILAILRQALKNLPPQDRLIAVMRGEFQVVRIAKTLGLEQKPLYRRIEKIFSGLREQLLAKGVRAEDIREILGFPQRDFEEEEPEK